MKKSSLIARLTAFATSAVVTFSIVAVIAEHWAPSHTGQLLALAQALTVA